MFILNPLKYTLRIKRRNIKMYRQLPYKSNLIIENNS